MNPSKEYALIFLVLILFSSQLAVAQCTQSLNRAEDEYEKGRLLDIPSMLSFCLQRNGFSKEEKIRAYKLLTKVYIFSDQEKQAEESLINLLRSDPEHQLNNLFDPAELFYLYEKFRVTPIFRIGAKLGVNFSMPNAFDNFSAFSASGDLRKYSSQLGISGELSIERHIINGLEIGTGLQFSASRFSVDEIFEDTGIVTSINETQTWIKVPVLARYNLFYDDRRKSVLPYAFGGASVNFLVEARFADSERQGGTQRSINGYDLLEENERKSINYSLFFGGGVKIRSNKVHFFTVETRYELGLLNYVNSENRYVSNASVNGLAYVPDNLSLNYLSFSLGYTRSIYNPTKKRKANK